jgi:hypothetical protein
MRIPRRAAVALAGAALSAGAVVGLAGPAQALPPGCTGVTYSFSQSQDGTQLISFAYLSCPLGGGEEWLPTSISQYNPATGTWQVVASGTGSAVYHCVGTTARQYEATGAAPRTYSCG